MKIHSTYTVFYNDPEDTNELITSADRLLDGGACAFSVYDTSKITTLDAAVGSFGTVLPVVATSSFLVGEAVEVVSPDGLTFSRDPILSIQDGVSLTLTNSVGISGHPSGSIVRRVLGVAPFTLSMTLFGTPKVDDKTWGYSGVISSSFAGLAVGMQVEIVIRFTDNGIHEKVVLCETVTEECET